MVGAAAMAKAKATTLILVTNTRHRRPAVEARADRPHLVTEEEIGEYSGEKKEDPPRHHRTHQVITRKSKGEYKHLELFDSRDWGLVIYDEGNCCPRRCSG